MIAVASRLALVAPVARTRMVAVWASILAVAAVVVAVVGRSGFEGQMYLVSVALVALVAAVVVPGAAAREPTVTAGFVAAALGAHLVGSLLRYLIIQAV